MSLVINNNNITDIAIGNREIIRVSDANSVVLWEKPYTVTYVKSITEDYSDCLAWSQASAIDTGVQHSNVNMKFRLKFKTKCGPTSDIWLFSNRIIGYTQGDDICTSDNGDFRFFGWQRGSFDWGGNRMDNFGMLAADTECDITMGVDTNGKPYLYDNIGETYKALFNITPSTPPTLNCKIFVDVRWIEVEELIIYNAQDNILFDGKAAYDSWGRIGLYDTVSNTMKYNSNLTMTYEEYPPSWLTFTSNDASARVKLLKAGNSAQYYLLTETFQYSVDEGTTWSQYTPDTYITVNLGDSVCFRGNNSGPFCKEEDNSTAYWVFETDGSFAVSGDITSLMNNVGGDIALPPSAFENMFSYSDITSAPNLPSTTISAYCYCQMFKMCTNLVTPPALTATTLADYCYYFMFYGCESMTSAPTLPATTLAIGCYANMFQNCESLTTPPALPATTLADSCYSSMFLGSAITTAPALPATILTTGCYSNMFRSCHSLILGPVLPATTLVTNCYDRMFLLDENLVDITTYATTWDTAKAYQWLDGVAATGTFHNLGMATIPTNDSSGIPTGWTEVYGQCETPVCSFVDGIYGSGCNNYNGTAVMTINCATAGATIYYKIGSGNFETYSSPVTLTTGSQTITTYATKANYTDSNNGTYSHTVPADQGQCVSDPNFRYEAVNGPATIILPYDENGGRNFCAYSSDGTIWEGVTYYNYTRTIQSGEKLYVRLFANLGTPVTINVSSGTVKIAGKLSTLINQGSDRDGEPVYNYTGSLFAGQTGIVDASDLIVNVTPNPFGTFKINAMFKNCSGLVHPPQLPLTLGTTGQYTGCYSEMFSGCTSLAYSPALPSTVVPEEGYKDMFTNCTALTTAGAISAITVGDGGMRNMFNNCTHLTTAPSLAFTSVGIQGCSQMFYNCQSMVTPPATLPATTLANSCYSYMFQNCYALRSAPSLPATNLAETCYYWMFANCGNLAIAPDLPAVTMQNGCYTAMFNQCSSLSSINVKITDWDESSAFGWVSGVAQSGTFTKYGAATIPTGMNGIPTGWTVVDNGETPILAAPTINFENAVEECWDGSAAGLGYANVTASYESIQNATFYIRYCLDGDDITQESWVETNSVTITDSLGGDYIVQAKATKSGWNNSTVAETIVTILPSEQCPAEPDCTDCNYWSDCGYQSYEDCQCQQYGEECGEDYCQECIDACEGDPDCEAVCNECDQPCGEPCVVDCTDWENVGYESYEDCDCSENGNCPEEEEPEEEPEE